VGVAVGLSLPILFPLGHLLLFSYLWGSSPVDKKACTNSCWDTVFKGKFKINPLNIGFTLFTQKGALKYIKLFFFVN